MACPLSLSIFSTCHGRTFKKFACAFYIYIYVYIIRVGLKFPHRVRAVAGHSLTTIRVRFKHFTRVRARLGSRPRIQDEGTYSEQHDGRMSAIFVLLNLHPNIGKSGPDISRSVVDLNSDKTDGITYDIPLIRMTRNQELVCGERAAKL